MANKRGKFVKKAAGITLTALLATGALAVFPGKEAALAGGNSITLFRIYTDAQHSAQDLYNQGIDIWEAQPNFVEAPLTSDEINWLQAGGWDYKMSRQANGPSFDSSYRTYTAVQQVLADRAAKFKNLATVVTIGNSFEGQPIQAIKITNAKSTANKPKSLWIGGTHAREISPPEVMMSNIDYLLNGYGNDPDVTWLLDNREVWIVPVINVDGHRKAEQLLNWRKNTDTRWGSTGVDLNRNYAEKPEGIWGTLEYGASPNPASSIYSGPYAFSEPETAAIKNLVESVMGPTGTPETVPNGFRLVVDMHSYGNLIMWPWNWTKDVTQLGAASDIERMQLIGEKWASYNTYKAEIGSKLYATVGDTTDWAYGFHKIPSFTIEIGKTFWPSNRELEGQIQENRGPFLHGLKILDDMYGRVGGPDSVNLQAAAQNGSVVVNGSADDTTTGKNKVQEVEVFVDKLGARGTGYKAALGSATNSGSITSFSASVPASGLSKGKHLVIVESQDETGAWGAPTATWVEIK